MPPLLKKLLTASNGGELNPLRLGENSAKATRFEYAFFGEDCLVKGGVVLSYTTKTYSNFSLTTFGLVPATSPEGVFGQEASGEIVIQFKVNFAEGEAVDSLQGTLTLLNGRSQKARGQWIASVRSEDCEVARAKGTWSRRKL